MTAEILPLYHELVEKADWTYIFHYLITQKNIKWDDFRTKEGMPLIARASLDPNVMVINNLIQLGANPNSSFLFNKQKISPLWNSIERNYHDNVKILIQHNADINFFSPLFNTTPILYYTNESNELICNMLVEHGSLYYQTNSLYPNSDYDYYPLAGWIKNMGYKYTEEASLLTQKLINLHETFPDIPVNYDKKETIIEHAYKYWKTHLNDDKYLYLYHLLESKYMRSDKTSYISEKNKQFKRI